MFDIAAGAEASQIDLVVQRLIDGGTIRVDRAQEILSELRA